MTFRNAGRVLAILGLVGAWSPVAQAEPRVREVVQGLAARFEIQAGVELGPHGARLSPFVRAPFEFQAVASGARADLQQGYLPAMRVELPLQATGELRVARADGRAQVAFRLEGVAPRLLEVDGNSALYRGAAPGGGDVLVRTRADGLEDHLELRARPASGELVYRVRIGAVAGLRVVADNLELLDERGTPLMRMHAPTAVDARGQRVPLHVTVSECAFDPSPRVPWNRPVTPPGSEECRVSIAIPPDLALPALVDPAWTSGGSYTALASAGAAKLASGRVLISSSGASIFDPETTTWSAIPGPDARHDLCYPLPTTTLVFCLGTFSHLFDEATGLFTPAQPPPESKRFIQDSPETVVSPWRYLLRWRAGTWAPVADPTARPDLHFSNEGFTYASDGAGVVYQQSRTRVERFDGNALEMRFSPELPTSLSVGGATLTHLRDGRLVVVGGLDPNNELSGDVQLLAADSDWVLADGGTPSHTWTRFASIPRGGHSTDELPDGRLIVVGGTHSAMDSAVVDVDDGTTVALPLPSGPRGAHQSVWLNDGRLLIAGGVGWDGVTQTATTTADLLDPAQLPPRPVTDEPAPEGGVAGPAADPAADDAGCGCQVPGSHPGHQRAGALALLGALTIVLRTLGKRKVK